MATIDYQTVLNSTPGLTANDAPPSAVDSVLSMATPSYLKTKAAEMAALFKSLTADQSKIPAGSDLQAQYNSLMSQGASIMSAVNGATGVFDEVAAGWQTWSNWIGNITSDVLNWFNFQTSNTYGSGNQSSGTGGLGFIVLAVGAAVVIAGLAAITYWLTQAYSLKAKIDAMQKLTATGVDPTTAANTVNSFQTSGSVTGNVASITKYAAWGLGIFALIKFLPMLKRERS